MIIIYHCITSSTQKLFSELNNYHIELFNIDELRFNLTKHKLVPTHIKLSDAQQQSFLQTFGEKIPIILKTDPISKIYDYKRNDIVKIIRPGNEVSYRICK
jgi:DNA-directed RNA polymerase I, II, and III subunit RPABC1